MTDAIHPIFHLPRRRFTPCFVIALILGLCLLSFSCGQEPDTETAKPAAAPPPAVETAGTIAAVGDSLTAGLGVSEDTAWPARLEARLRADGYPWRVVNAGISGETSSGALSRIEWVVSALKPDIVILETGANDGLRGIAPDVLRANLDDLVAFLRGKNIVVILAGMEMLPNLGPEYTRAFSEIYPAVASKHGITLIPFFLEGVAGEPRLNQADGIHPTAEGYQRVLETVYPYVLEAIEQIAIDDSVAKIIEDREIVYRVMNNIVHVLLIVDGRRDMQSLLQRRLLNG